MKSFDREKEELPEAGMVYDRSRPPLSKYVRLLLLNIVTVLTYLLGGRN